MAMFGQSFIFIYLVFLILFPSGFLFLACCCYSLASVRATTPRLGWIDVCSYSDPTGSSCCSPGMENKGDMSRLSSHWSISYITLLSLVESLMRVKSGYIGNKEYLVVPEKHDWFGHIQACR